MGYTELMNWQSAFLDVGCVRLMFYLAKYNPNKHFEEIKEKLEMSEKELSQKINKLIDADMVLVNDVGQFTLNDRALIGLNKFLSLTK